MATQEEIARFRRMTDLPENTEPWTDDYISNIIDQLGFEKAVASAWTEKAAAVASLVDTTESGSSRRLSQLRESYLDMARTLGGADAVDSGQGSFTVGIERV